MRNHPKNEALETTRRSFVAGAVGIGAAGMAAATPFAAFGGFQAEEDDPGIAYVLSHAQRERGASLLRQVFTPFMGEWIGTRTGKDTGTSKPVLFTKRYSLFVGGPQFVTDVKAVVDGVVVFGSAMPYAYSPQRNTILTYFFESGGNVQIYELDREASFLQALGEDPGRLIWNEILRKGRLFRVEETIPKNDEWTSTILRQDANGEYQIFARNTLRRKWKETLRKRARLDD